jgi:hypothetical protein
MSKIPGRTKNIIGRHMAIYEIPLNWKTIYMNAEK